MYNIQLRYTIYNIQQTIDNIQQTIDNIQLQYTVYNRQYTIDNIQYTIYNYVLQYAIDNIQYPTRNLKMGTVFKLRRYKILIFHSIHLDVHNTSLHKAYQNPSEGLHLSGSKTLI